MSKKVLVSILVIIVFLGACTPTSASPTLDMNEVNAQAIETVFASMTQTVEAMPPTVTPTETPLPTATAPRTPPALPPAYSTGILNPLDVPQTYEDDTCQYLQNKWNPNNASPGTVVMVVMFHSITGDEITNPNQVSL